MAKYYAWSPVRVDVDEHNKAKSVVGVGDEVTPAKLKISQEEFDSLVEVGAVREQPYPPVSYDGQSPTEYFKELAAKAGGGNLSGDEMNSLSEFFNAATINDRVGIAPPADVEESEGTTGGK